MNFKIKDRVILTKEDPSTKYDRLKMGKTYIVSIKRNDEWFTVTDDFKHVAKAWQNPECFRLAKDTNSKRSFIVKNPWNKPDLTKEILSPKEIEDICCFKKPL